MSPVIATPEGVFPFSPRSHRAREIRWLEWGDGAFAEARISDKPILLSVVTFWSTEAYGMDEGAYSDQRIIDLLAEQFVAVRVDGDERPDVAARYMLPPPATLPAVAFLTPEGDPIETFGVLDADTLVHAAHGVLNQWFRDREAVSQRIDAARAMRAAERAAARATRAPGILTPSILDAALEIVHARWVEDPPGLDEDHGTVGLHPHPEVLRLLRYAFHRRWLAPEFNRAFALGEAMVAGALYDRVDGGFFRSASSGWAEAAPEKLARTQGEMLLALAELAHSDEEAAAAFEDVIEGTASYLASSLGDATGAIVASEVTEPGAMDVDRRVFTASAAVGARGLLRAGILRDRRDWVERGRRIVDFLLSRARAGEAGMYHAWDGSPRTLGILDDQAQMLLALLEAYEVSGQGHYFEQARQIARVVDRDWHEPGLGFRDLADGSDDLGLLAEPRYPLAENADMAEALIWLARLTHDDRHLSTAQETLGAFAHGLEGRGLVVANYARVVDRLLSAEPEIKVVAEYPAGEPDAVADPLHAAALRLRLPGRTVQRLDRVGDAELIRQLGLPDVGRVAYVCSGSTCLGPLTDPEQFLPTVEELLGAPAW
ncbi:MAG: DUF255 domain-containing protein [Dehalococcoidia bacterium]